MIMEEVKKKDCHVEEDEFAKIKGFKQRILTFRTEKDRPPLLNLFWFGFFTIFGLSLPYRLYFNSVSGYLDYNVHKVIQC